mgnify:CR=1 FL=1
MRIWVSWLSPPQELAQAEEDTIQKLLRELVQLQSLRVARKLQHVDELSAALQQQQQNLEEERAALVRARQHYLSAAAAQATSAQ